jgi:type II secretion system protein N
VRFVAIPLAGVLLFLCFLHLGFPYDRIADRLAARLGEATRSQVRIQAVSSGLSLAGPGLEATGVTFIGNDGARFDLERVFLRPAWSLAWLRGDPAVHVDATSLLGAAQGVATLRRPGFTGRLLAIDLARLPLAAVYPGTTLRGEAELELDLAQGDAGPEGSARITARDGVFSLPALPGPLPFTSFEAQLRFGGESFAQLSDATFTGPLLSARASGSLARAERPFEAPLALELELSPQPALRHALQTAGISLGPDGKAKLQVAGTPAHPTIR